MKNKFLIVVVILCCIVCIPITIYLAWKAHLQMTINSITNYRKIIKDYSDTIAPLTSSPIPCKVFYINLDRSSGRKATFEKSATALMMDYQRVSAFDARKMMKATTTNNFKQYGMVDGIQYINDFYDNMSFSEIACTLSHLKAIRVAYDQKLKYAMICEDDVSFELHPLWPKNIIQTLLDKMDKDVGILQLFWNHNDVKASNTSCAYEKNYTIREYKKGGNCWCACGYIITKKGMVDVLRHSSFLQGNSIHLQRTPMVSMGFADGYIFQATLTVNSGFPLVVPNNETHKTTQEDRGQMNMNDWAALELYNRVLKEYTNNNRVALKSYQDKPLEETYRLSDAIFGNYKKHWTKKYHTKWYPNSLVGQYFRETDMFGNMDILTKIVMNNRPTLIQIPPKDAVVIHLRLGDAIERCNYSVDEHLKQELPFTSHPGGKVWVHSKSYYDKKLMEFDNINKIILVYGKHRAAKEDGFSSGLSKTTEYINKLVEHFKANRYQVDIHDSNFDPDQDFLFLCFAQHLIAGGGSGYSNLALELNTRIKT